MWKLVVVALVAMAATRVRGEEAQAATGKAEEVEDFISEDLEDMDDEDYDYEDGEEEGEWPEEWGDQELDDYDYDMPHGGEL